VAKKMRRRWGELGKGRHLKKRRVSKEGCLNRKGLRGKDARGAVFRERAKACTRTLIKRPPGADAEDKKKRMLGKSAL